MKEITNDMLAQFRASYDTDGQAQVLHSALAKTDMAELASVPVAGARLKGAFSVEVKTAALRLSRSPAAVGSLRPSTFCGKRWLKRAIWTSSNYPRILVFLR